MPPEEKFDKKKTVENFSEMFRVFGDAIGKIFDDPELKKKAKEFTESAASSAKLFGSRFKDEEVEARFRDAGKAAKTFGESVVECFKSDRDEKEE